MLPKENKSQKSFLKNKKKVFLSSDQIAFKLRCKILLKGCSWKAEKTMIKPARRQMIIKNFNGFEHWATAELQKIPFDLSVCFCSGTKHQSPQWTFNVALIVWKPNSLPS